MTVLSVFQNIGDFCVAVSVGTRFGKTDLDVVVPLPIHLYG